MDQDSINWLDDVTNRRDGYDQEAVKRFGDRLLRLASSRIPDRLQRRVDAEDIVQSVFRSFFTRHEASQFEFDEVPDVWRLLAAMTYHKVQRAIRHHSRQKRDYSRDHATDEMVQSVQDISPTASSVAMMIELMEQILDELPDTHKTIVRLRMDGQTVAEIAEQVQLSTRTVIRALNLVRSIATEISDRP